MLHSTLIACLCLLPQEVDEKPDPKVVHDRALKRFSKLDVRRKATILRTLRRQVNRSGNSAMGRIAELAIDAELAAHEPPPHFDPEQYTPSVPLERVLIAKGTAKHSRQLARFPVPVFLPDLHRAVGYDWCRQQIVRIEDSLSYEELFENYLNGYAPGSDEALAQVMRRFDSGRKMRPYADWFGHAYCDRQGGVYEGITLYQAWYSGKIVEVPDIDALPFAWHILGRRSYRTPLGGRSRDRLYEAIRDSALKYRIHRSTCEAAAAAFIRAVPVMDGTYARLVPRFHYLFAKHEDDIDHVHHLVRMSGRDELIKKVDKLIRNEDGPAWEVRENRKLQLEAMAASLRQAALNALEKFGG